MNTHIKNGRFFKRFCSIDLKYYIIIRCMNLINSASKIDKTRDLATKLHLNFISPLFKVIKNKLILLPIDDNIDFYRFYHKELSKEELLKIEKIINSNIDTFEIVFTPMPKIIDQARHAYQMSSYKCSCDKKCICHYCKHCP